MLFILDAVGLRVFEGHGALKLFPGEGRQGDDQEQGSRQSHFSHESPREGIVSGAEGLVRLAVLSGGYSSFTGWLFVRDHLAHGGDTLLDAFDLFRPGASGGIGIGEPGGVLALGFGEMVQQNVQTVL